MYLFIHSFIHSCFSQVDSWHVNSCDCTQVQEKKTCRFCV